MPEYTFGPFNLDLSPRLIIKDLNLEVRHPITQFWGVNGVGKSTLLKLILEELKAERATFAYIDQNYRKQWLWWKQPYQNLQIVLPKDKNLKDLDFYKRQATWLEPLLSIQTRQIDLTTDSPINKIGLSGGQLQRLILFRELLREPKILLLDEAFSALDEEVSEDIVDWLLEEQKNLGFYIISIIHNSALRERLGGQTIFFEKESDNILKLNYSDVQK